LDEFSEILKFLENYEKNNINKTNEESFLIEKIPHTQYIKDLDDCTENQVPIQTNNDSNSGFDITRFEQQMRDELIKEYHQFSNYTKTYTSVTELMSCLKKVYFQRKKYEIDLQSEFKFSYLYLIKEIGKLVHKLVQRLYKFDEIEKTIISKKFNVKGRIDAIKGNTLYEIKTIDNEKFENKYELSHYQQGDIYAHILNNDYNYKIKDISIIYVGRNLKTIFPFNNLPLNNQIAESFLNKSLILTECLNKNIIPKDENKNDCMFCSYKKYCSENMIISRPANKNAVIETKDENIKSKSKFIL
jgi:CRISPR/Cas system-associated exonuclease Cas4 (RecB family)